jgi:hypothetical protein
MYAPRTDRLNTNSSKKLVFSFVEGTLILSPSSAIPPILQPAPHNQGETP